MDREGPGSHLKERGPPRQGEQTGVNQAQRRDGQTAPPPLPLLTVLGDKLGGDSCLKCGKNRAVVTGHDVTSMKWGFMAPGAATHMAWKLTSPEAPEGYLTPLALGMK